MTKQEDCNDISNYTSNNIDEYCDIDFVITVCDNAEERYTFFTAKAQKFYCNFPDPAIAKDEEI